ncbi:hypothetical protein [Oceanibacterium hippocampi]|uniref:Uncharacterized protein n=1 Tax=Oceanibacterium hippocampi TaxID=745714 RepID=A0A1Y5RIU0_9PROT|nr:hypothetical protein [Oceanibacterium hippocampi]SLN18606.1 hypothetical protein OCH7691_00400 [Oceanibacterium hippocampi]
MLRRYTGLHLHQPESRDAMRRKILNMLLTLAFAAIVLLGYAAGRGWIEGEPVDESVHQNVHR